MADKSKWDTTELDRTMEAAEAAGEKSASSGKLEDVKDHAAKTILALDAARQTYKRMRGEEPRPKVTKAKGRKAKPRATR